MKEKHEFVTLKDLMRRKGMNDTEIEAAIRRSAKSNQAVSKVSSKTKVISAEEHRRIAMNTLYHRLLERIGADSAIYGLTRTDLLNVLKDVVKTIHHQDIDLIRSKK